MCLLMLVMTVDLPVEAFPFEVSWEEVAGDNYTCLICSADGLLYLRTAS